MRTYNRVSALMLLSFCLQIGSVHAASVADVIYEKVDMFKGAVHFTDSFMVEEAGTYRATLTDFKFPNAFKSSGLNVTTVMDSLGKLSQPGAFTFEADPGNYFVSMFAKVGQYQVSAEEKQRMMEEEQRKRGKSWWSSLTREEKLAKKALWKTWSKEEMKAEQEAAKKRTERAVNKQLAAMSLGQYGIEIAQLNMTMGENYPNTMHAVPLPATAWFLFSGLVALTGFVRRSRKLT